MSASSDWGSLLTHGCVFSNRIPVNHLINQPFTMTDHDLKQPPELSCMSQCELSSKINSCMMQRSCNWDALEKYAGMNKCSFSIFNYFPKLYVGWIRHWFIPHASLPWRSDAHIGKTVGFFNRCEQKIGSRFVLQKDYLTSVYRRIGNRPRER